MEKTINFKDAIINYEVTGTGPVIVLLHGFVESIKIWEELTGILRKKFTVLAVDLPGHGKSDLIEDVTIDLMADIVYEVIRNENLNNIVLTGHSMGGYVAMAFADKYGSALSGLCLFHSSALDDNQEKKENRLRAIEAVKKDHKDFVVALVDKLFKEGNQKKYPAEADILKDIAKNTTSESVIASLMAMRNRPDRTNILPNLHVPVLFIIGKADRVLEFESVFPQLKLPAICQSLILSDAGHLGFIEARSICFHSIEKFAEFCTLNQGQ